MFVSRALFRIAIVFTCVCGAVVSSFAEETRERRTRDRSFGDYILDGLEAGIATEQLAREVIGRARQIKRAVTGEEPLPAATEWAPDEETTKRKGPPDWAPAHGWRRNFGEEEEASIGAFASKQVEEGVVGEALAKAIRGHVDRLVASGGDDDKGDKDEAKSQGQKKGRSNQQGKGKGRQ